MDGLRDVLYRPYKLYLAKKTGDRIVSIGSAKPRLASPLIIQIKRTTGGNYFGILLAFENTQYLGASSCHLETFLKGTSSLTSVEVTLP